MPKFWFINNQSMRNNSDKITTHFFTALNRIRSTGKEKRKAVNNNFDIFKSKK